MTKILLATVALFGLPGGAEAQSLQSVFTPKPTNPGCAQRIIPEMEGALDMKSITLQFHSITTIDGEHLTVAEAIDNSTGGTVASYSLSMMDEWLKRHGYHWRFASSGIWDQQQRVACDWSAGDSDRGCNAGPSSR
jgi:hypothetical protein